MSVSNQTYLNELNEVQRKAVTHIKGPVLVVAGPGSGKTRVLTYRIAHLIESGIPAYQILALTFTNKAAREMKKRIEKVVGNKANNVWAGTFHSIFARILRVEAEKIGYPSNFTIYDTEDTKSVIKNIIKEMQLNKDVYNFNTIRSRISSAKSNLITPKRYLENEQLMAEDRQVKRPYTQAIYAKYTARCKKAGAMDFDDLLYRLYELLQSSPEVLEKYRKKFPFVLVDEFQDTNQLQYAIVKKLVHYDKSERNICVVGDDAQSIYAFRGATIQNILDFEADFKPFGIEVYKLEQNYRSTESIVQAANEVIQYNKRQIQKKIWSHKGEGHRIKIFKALTDADEGKLVSDSILEQKNRFHISNEEIAILYRTNSQSRIFEEALRRINIPYKVVGGLSFYQRKEVKDLAAYLKLAVNQNDEEALRRVINYPKRAIGPSTVDKINAVASENEITLWQAIPLTPLAKRTKNNVAAFVHIIKEFAKLAKEKDAYTAANLIAKKSGLVDLLSADTTQEGLGRKDNLNALLDGIKAFVDEDTVIDTETIPDKSLATYLQNIALLTDQDDENKTKDSVTLMSVHAAKGLEFKSVFVVGLEEKLFPSFMSMDTIEGLDEERRLFYVAITRAEQLLTVSYSASRYRYGNMRYNEPSRFLEELPRDHIESTGVVKSRQSGTPPSTKGSTASVSGYFKKQNNIPRIDPKDFKPAPSSEIQVGMKILHLKFGRGKVLSIDGGKDNRIASIHFENIDTPQRRIMLKYAKLQILD
ncbi:MAG: UvrD-helicase domain-containing protein [Bacteroidota bacterium]